MPAPKDPIKYQQWKEDIRKRMTGRILTEEWKRKISESTKGRIGTWKGQKRPPRSKEWGEKIAEANRGRKPWNTGLKTGPISDEHKKKISTALMGIKRIRTREHQLKIITTMQKNKKMNGKKRPLEVIEKIKKKRAAQILPMRDSYPERLAQQELIKNGIEFIKHKSIMDGFGFYHTTDIFIEPNICIEIDGDFWHANPKKYTAEQLIKTRNNKKLIAYEVWQHDLMIDTKLTQLGYKIIRIWESEIKSNPQILRQRIQETKTCVVV